MRRELLILMVVGTLVFASCSQGSTGGGGNSKAFIGGTVGISSAFMDGQPPSEVTSTNFPFSVSIELKNQGEWTVPNAQIWVTLKGFDPQDFGAATSALADLHPDGGQDLERNTLDGDTGTPIEGSPAYVSINNLQYSVPITGNHAFPFVADICYEYKTLANAELCLKKDLLNAKKDTSVCQVSGPKLLQNSGAPVQVSQFVEYPAGQNAVRFSATISAVGKGDVSKSINTGASTHCSTVNSEKNVVHVKINTGLTGTVTCPALGGGSEGDVRLSNGIAMVQCTQQVPTLIDAIKLVNFELSYTYLDNIQTQVLVKELTT